MTQWLWDASLEAHSTEVWWRRSFVPVLLCSNGSGSAGEKRAKVAAQMIVESSLPNSTDIYKLACSKKAIKVFKHSAGALPSHPCALGQEVGEHQRRPSRLRNSFCPGAVQLLTLAVCCCSRTILHHDLCNTDIQDVSMSFFLMLFIERVFFFAFYKVYLNIL